MFNLHIKETIHNYLRSTLFLAGDQCNQAVTLTSKPQVGLLHAYLRLLCVSQILLMFENMII